MRTRECRGTCRKRLQHSEAKPSEKNYPSTVLLGKIAQASCQQAPLAPVVPLLRTRAQPGSRQRHPGWLTPQRQRSQSQQAGVSLSECLYSMDDNPQLIHQLTASTTLPAAMSKVPH